MLTYGDGVANIDLNALVEFHKSHGKFPTITVVRPSQLVSAVILILTLR